MRILYVAKFGNHDNCDEEAIAYALEQLGHTVERVHESRRYREGLPIGAYLYGAQGVYDFCLFHKHEVVSEVAAIAEVIPCAFWYFDLLSNDDDPTLAARMQQRRRWFRDVIQHCVTAFVTDGDWVDHWNNGDPRERVSFQNEGQNRYSDVKIHWLMQGADERFVGLGEPRFKPAPDILFTGTRHHGRKREEHVAELERRYGNRFGVVGETRQTPRKHGRELADLFASTKVVVAPDGPCTDRYWSNRVYLTAGLGGYILHPELKGLQPHYNTAEVRQYRSREELYRMIDYALECPGEIPSMRMFGHHATVQRNLYRHRCQDLIRVMEGVL